MLGVDTRASRPRRMFSPSLTRGSHGALSDRLAEIIVAGEPVQLIETLAERLAQACLAEVAVQEVELTVHKPAAPVSWPFADIAVTITRRRA